MPRFAANLSFLCTERPFFERFAAARAAGFAAVEFHFPYGHGRAGLDIIDAVGSDNLRLQYDVYHAQAMQGDLARTLQESLPRIGHVQLADNPGRHEPGSGEINFPFLVQGAGGWP